MSKRGSVRTAILGLQMLRVAFVALVLVPLLTALSPCIALFTADAGTLLFHAVTKGRVPIFLASSFAFIAPIQQGNQQFGMDATLGGLSTAGIVYLALSWKARPTRLIPRSQVPLLSPGLSNPSTYARQRWPPFWSHSSGNLVGCSAPFPNRSGTALWSSCSA